MDNIQTFDFADRRRPLTFAEAIRAHAMMQKPTKDFIAAHRRTDSKRTERALDWPELAELWEGLMAPMDEDDCATIMPMCVAFTIPSQFVTVVRRAAGTAAAFAYCEIVKALHGVDLTDDLEVRHAMDRAWKEFDKRAREANDVKEGYGCDDSQSWLTLRDIGPHPDVRAKMIAIAQLAGRMYRDFDYHRRTTKNKDPEEVVGARMGGSIDRTLATELALLGDADTEDVQAMKILSNRQYTTDMEGVESQSRGPLVLAVDESGSMHDGDIGWRIAGGNRKWGGRNTFAKACCVALTRIAWDENRAVRCVHFGNSTEVQEVPKDDHRAMFEMARSFLSGGTSIGSALERGRIEVGDLEANGHKGADVVLITDGCDDDASYHNREIDIMDEQGVNLWTVAIGPSIAASHPIRKRAQRYTHAHDRDLGDHDTASQLAQGLNEAAMGNGTDLN